MVLYCKVTIFPFIINKYFIGSHYGLNVKYPSQALNLWGARLMGSKWFLRALTPPLTLYGVII